MITPLPAEQALDQYFLEARSKLLDLAAILDRVDRGQGNAGVDNDPRIEQIHRALGVLHERSGGRAERVQQVFSLAYDPAWDRPQSH